MSTITRDGVDSLSIDRGEPDWLKSIRINAWEKYLQLPNPRLKDDQWRKTKLESLDLGKIKTTFPKAEKPAEDLVSGCPVLKRFPERAGVIYSTQTNTWLAELDASLKESGVVFAPLAEAVKTSSNLIKSMLDKMKDELEVNKFDYMQEALFNCGAVLHIPNDVVIEKPIVIVTRIDDTRNGSSLFPRIFVSGGTHSKATIINVFTSTRSKDSDHLSLINAQTSIHAEAGSNLSYIEVQDLNDNIFFVGKSKNVVDRDATCASLTVGVSGYQLKSDIITRLTERGANGSMLGVVVGDKKEHLSYNTVQMHDAPDTTSDINFRVALKDQAVSAYQGNIVVAKHAQKTNAFQTNKNLLLGKEAKADSIPKLEILANDVKCSHGATVGPVDENQVFYLMTRGLDEKTAEELIVAGFFDTVLESLPDKTANDWIHDLVKNKIYDK